ncbi:group I truncated hemoglobin [Colwellia sp. MEBiC06753]
MPQSVIHMIKPFLITARISVFCTLLISCTASNNSTSSLYEEIGGAPAVEQIVDAFIVNIAKDKQVLPYFIKANVEHFRQGFIQHFCHATGGPCQYQGDSMVDIHKGMNINEADFNRIVELLVSAMEQAALSYPLQNKVLARLAPLREEIIRI